MKITDFFGCTSTASLPVAPLPVTKSQESSEKKTAHVFFSSPLPGQSQKSVGNSLTALARLISKEQIDNGSLNEEGFFYCQELGTTFRGKLVNSRLTGEGEIINLDGTTTQGNFIEGFLNGPGIVLLPNTGRWEGIFCKGVLHGYGEITDKNGATLEKGVFEKGTLVKKLS